MAVVKTGFGQVNIASETVNDDQVNEEIEASGIMCEVLSFTVSAPEAAGVGIFHLKDASGKLLAAGASSLAADSAHNFVKEFSKPYPVANGLDVDTPLAPDTNTTWTVTYKIIPGSKAL